MSETLYLIRKVSLGFSKIKLGRKDEIFVLPFIDGIIMDGHPISKVHVASKHHDYLKMLCLVMDGQNFGQV